MGRISCTMQTTPKPSLSHLDPLHPLVSRSLLSDHTRELLVLIYGFPSGLVVGLKVHVLEGIVDNSFLKIAIDLCDEREKRVGIK